MNENEVIACRAHLSLAKRARSERATPDVIAEWLEATEACPECAMAFTGTVGERPESYGVRIAGMVDVTVHQ